MGRPKGSRNKPKEETPDVGAEVSEAVVPEAKPWTPAPDMGAIKPPPDEESLCSNCTNCGDPRQKWHYGPDGKTWCNLCACQVFVPQS